MPLVQTVKQRRPIYAVHAALGPGLPCAGQEGRGTLSSEPQRSSQLSSLRNVEYSILLVMSGGSGTGPGRGG